MATFAELKRQTERELLAMIISGTYPSGTPIPGRRDQLTTSTDPALNAAVTTAIVDVYDGVIITTTGAANDQTIQDPTDVSSGKRFRVVNSSTSTDPVDVIIGTTTVTLGVGESVLALWEGAVWAPTEDYESADEVFYDNSGSTTPLVATDVEAALDEIDLNQNTHQTSDGSDHTYIDQDVTSGSSPTFDGANLTGVDAANVDIVDAGGIIAATDVEGALQENRTAIDLNTAHSGSDGSDHSFIDQDVTSGSAPTFTADNFSDGGSNAIITTTQETNYDAAYTHATGDGSDHADVATNTAFKGTLDALNGVVACDGAGNYSAKTIGIADDNLLEVDDVTAADNDYAKFTLNGLEGRTYAEVKQDLSLDNVENTALSTWSGSGNIATLGTVTSGTISTGAVIADPTMTLGSDADYDMYYRSDNKLTRLAPNTTATQKFLAMTGTGAAGQAPTWETVSAGAFSTTSNVTSNSPGTLATDDFVFGSTSLVDDGNADHDKRMLFDKSQGSFAAGCQSGTGWNNIGAGTAVFGTDNDIQYIIDSLVGGTGNSVSSGNTFCAGKNNSISRSRCGCVGESNSVTGYYSWASGNDASTYLRGQTSQSGGSFSADGDAQTSKVVLRADTTDDTPETMYIDNSSSNKVVIPANTAWHVQGWVVAKQASSANCSYHEFTALLVRDGSNNTTLKHNAVTDVYNSDIATTVAITADDANEALAVGITGVAATNINWVCTLNLTEVG